MNDGSDPQNPGIVTGEGIDIQRIVIPSQNLYSFSLAIFGTTITYDQTYAGIGSGSFEVGTGGAPLMLPDNQIVTKVQIPSWIKTNAGWWEDGLIDDNAFVQGIQFLIKEGIMKIPPTSQGSSTGSDEIPAWIKTNAGWWEDGLITDNDFVQGIQFLIEKGIISV